MRLIQGALLLLSLCLLLVVISYGATYIEVNSGTPNVPATQTSNVDYTLVANPTWQKSATAAQATLIAQSTPLWAQATAILATITADAKIWGDQQTAIYATATALAIPTARNNPLKYMAP